MGGCCVDRRKEIKDSLPKNPDETPSKVNNASQNFQLTNEELGKIILGETCDMFNDSEAEVESLIDFYCCPLESFCSSWKSALIESQKMATPPSSGQDCDKSFPYLITSFYDKGDFVMVCSKPFPTLYKSQIREIEDKGFIHRYIINKITLTYKTETDFRNEIKSLLT